MNAEIITKTARATLEGTITFPEVVINGSPTSVARVINTRNGFRERLRPRP